MRKVELIQTNNSYVRLTITPDRITLKTRTPEEEVEIGQHLNTLEKKFDEIEEFDKTKSWRGELRGKFERSFHMTSEPHPKGRRAENFIRLII